MFKYIIKSKDEESVYNLVDKTEKLHLTEKLPNGPLYRSIYSAKVREDQIVQKTGQSKTLGMPRISIEDPAKFLKKHSKRSFATRPQSVPSRLSIEKETQADLTAKPTAEVKPRNKVVHVIRPKTCTQHICTNQRPPIPCAGTPLQIIIQENKDFVKTNALNVQGNSKLASKPKTLRYVDMSNGNLQNWHNSGLAPRYTLKKNFGKVPQYVGARKKELQQLQDQMQRESEEESPDIRKLNEEEINDIVLKLKENWQKVFFLYQSLPLQIDTPGKIKRKSALEKELKKIEKDIQTFQRHDTIYVADVPRSYYVPQSTIKH